jgi:hypothetical protein
LTRPSSAPYAEWSEDDALALFDAHQWGGTMKAPKLVLITLLLFCPSLIASHVCAEAVCVTHDRAMGFTTEKGLVEFIAKAKAGPEGLKQYLNDLVSKKRAVILKGGLKANVVNRKKSADPSLDVVKARIIDDNKVLWVPGGALDCK